MNYKLLFKFHTSIQRSVLFRFTVILSCLLFVWKIRFPFIFSKIYAEDGALFLHDALELKFPTDFLTPAAGYSTLIMRIGGQFVSFFPLTLSAVMCGLFAAFNLAILSALIFKYNNLKNDSSWSRYFLVFTFLFLPLSSYSAIGNITNLYIYWMIASGVLLSCRDSSNKALFYKSVVFLIATLSLPLTFFLLPIMLFRIISQKKVTGYSKFYFSDICFLLGCFLQTLFILMFSFGERYPQSPQPFLKTFYLYLDRGIGSSIIPMWGFVSAENTQINYENSFFAFESLYVRFLIVAIIMCIIIFLFYQYKSLIPMIIKQEILLLTVLGFIYSILIGSFFNPEPRYMLFTSFLTFWVLIMIFDFQKKHMTKIIFSGIIGFVLILGLNSSEHRSAGPEWLPVLLEAKVICEKKDLNYEVKLTTIPINANWEVKLSCRNLLE